jgi:hypothetical protein
MPKTRAKKSTTRIILSRAGRLWLMAVVVVFLVGAIACLFWIGRGEAIRSEMKTAALIDLLGFYMPLLSLMAAFYFGGRQPDRDDKASPLDTFVVALVFTSLWTLVPMFLLLFGGTIEDILETLKKMKPFGDTLALAAIGYYFSNN